MTLCHQVVNKIPFCCQDPINKVSKEKKITRTFTDYFTKKLYKSIFDIFTLWLVLSAITTFEIEAPYNCAFYGLLCDHLRNISSGAAKRTHVQNTDPQYVIIKYQQYAQFWLLYGRPPTSIILMEFDRNRPLTYVRTRNVSSLNTKCCVSKFH